MAIKMSEVRERADEIEAYFVKYPDANSYTLSTTADYEKGYYGSDTQKGALMCRPVVNEMRARGYDVSYSYSHEFHEYNIIPKIIMD